MSTFKEYPRMWLISAVLLGIGVDWLLFGQPVGIGLLLLCALTLGLLAVNGRVRQISPLKRNLWLLLPLFFFGTLAFLRANAFLTLLNVAAVVGLMAYVAAFYTTGRVSRLGLAGSAVLPARVAARSLAAPLPLVTQWAQNRPARLNSHGSAVAIVRGGVLAVPILMLFTVLLGSADLIFANAIDQFLSIDLLPKLGSWVRHGMLVLLSGWLLGGGILFALPQHGRDRDPDTDRLSQFMAAIPRRISLGFGETATILTLVNGLFLAFCLIQAAYLFGGARNISVEGLSYADYARRGFFELMATAILALGLILGLNWLTRRENKRQIRWFNLFGTATVGLVLLMLVSAWRRMSLYEAAYGFTELRLIVFTAMAWLVMLLVWFALTLWKRPDLFAIGALLVLIGWVGTLNLLNPDALIAQRNLARYAKTGDLDVVYLTSLSDDAVPLLTAALPTLTEDAVWVDDPYCQRGDDCTVTQAEILRRNLAGRYELRLNETGWREWQSYHRGRYRAFAVLDAQFGGAQ